MITQIEIDGFKTFKDFKVELAPFQVIVGPNGSGKSNLFDALQLLSRLMEHDLATAFQAIRGYTNELFTRLPGGGSLDRMRFAVEMLVDRKVQDDYGKSAELKYTRLRYEVEITLVTDTYGLDRLHIAHESLRSISQESDNWGKKYGLYKQSVWIPETTNGQAHFISTNIETIAILESTEDKTTKEAKQPIISLYPERSLYPGRDLYPDSNLYPQSGGSKFFAAEILRTVLSSITNVEYPHAFAAREELLSFKFLHLNPESLRKSSPAPAHQLAFLSQDGSNLPTMLARMQSENEFALTDVSRDMTNLVPGIFKIKVERNAASNEYDIWAETADRRTFSAKALSDGSLRLLAIAAIRNDLQFHGTLFLEEPENGVEPLHLKTMARVLREMATDFSDPEQRDEPLRQILITTHSPAFIGLPEIIDSLLFAHLVTIGGTDINSPLRITRMEPVVTSKRQPKKEGQKDRATEIYTIDSVRQYLARNNFARADNKLKKARTLSLEQ
jgi:predicted ATPase